MQARRFTPINGQSRKSISRSLFSDDETKSYTARRRCTCGKANKGGFCPNCGKKKYNSFWRKPALCLRARRCQRGFYPDWHCVLYAGLYAALINLREMIWQVTITAADFSAGTAVIKYKRVRKTAHTAAQNTPEKAAMAVFPPLAQAE